MKPLFISLLAASLVLVPALADDDEYTYFIRQIQMPDEVEWDVPVEQNGSEQSPLAVNPNGARFELWAVKSDPLTDYQLDTTYVNSYIPVAEVSITSEDPYSVIPRTRADRPFDVEITVNGLNHDPDAPDAAKSVKLLRHVQSYGANGTGENINRGQATLLSQGSLESNGVHDLSYAVTSIPGADRTKIRGEERFSVFSLEDYQAEESQLDSLYIQIWPIASGGISGLSEGEKIKGVGPDIEIELVDLYPDSWTYTQLYPGEPVLGTEGTLVPGGAILVDGVIPRTETLRLDGWDETITEDGTWTMEVITVTPFGTERLTYRTFEVERTITVNGAVTSLD